MPRFVKRYTTVLDTQQNLEWSHTLGDGKAMSHANAEKACADLGDGWRLPTVEELFLLADRNKLSPAIDTEFFADTKSDWYWPSTPYRGSSDYAWIVRFSDGSSGAGNRGHLNYVRAVRASQ